MTDRIKRLVSRANELLDRWRTTRILRATVAGFFTHEALQYAGSMAYFAILSLINLFILAVVAAAYIVGQGAARDFVVSRANQALPLGQNAIGSIIDRAVSARGSVGIIGLVLLLWSALGVFGALSSGIGRVFILAPKRPFWRDRLMGLGLLLATGIIAGASVGLGLAAQLIQSWASSTIGIPWITTTFGVLAQLVPVLLIFFAFLIVYRIVPNRPITVAEAWPGALLATILWSGLRVGFTYYTTQVAHYDSVFGPIGTAISLLVFLYFSSVILLIGAELVRAIALEEEAEATGTRPKEVSPTPVKPQEGREPGSAERPAPSSGGREANDHPSDGPSEPSRSGSEKGAETPG